MGAGRRNTATGGSPRCHARTDPASRRSSHSQEQDRRGGFHSCIPGVSASDLEGLAGLLAAGGHSKQLGALSGGVRDMASVADRGGGLPGPHGKHAASEPPHDGRGMDREQVRDLGGGRQSQILQQLGGFVGELLDRLGVEPRPIGHSVQAVVGGGSAATNRPRHAIAQPVTQFYLDFIPLYWPSFQCPLRFGVRTEAV